MAAESPKSAPRRLAAAKHGAGLLSPRFRSAAALAGWDEESILLAALVVEDTPVRESRRKRRPSSAGSGSAGSNTRKRRSRMQSPGAIPPVVLALDDEEKLDGASDCKKEVKEEEKVVVVGKKEASGWTEKAAATGELPCMDRLREELPCAVRGFVQLVSLVCCIVIAYVMILDSDLCVYFVGTLGGEAKNRANITEQSSGISHNKSSNILLHRFVWSSASSRGHSFCMKCLKHAAAKCGKRCPKCRQLISNSRSCTVNTVLWNTIQLLFPREVEARRISVASSSASNDDVNQSPRRSNSFAQGGARSRNTRGIFITQDNTSSSSNNNRNFITPGSRRSINTSSSFITQASSTRARDSGRGFVWASQLVTTRRSVGSDQSDDDALAYRLQQEEFMTAFESEAERQPWNSVHCLSKFESYGLPGHPPPCSWLACLLLIACFQFTHSCVFFW